MTDTGEHHNQLSLNSLLYSLQQRAKELNCLYQIEKLLSRPGITIREALEGTLLAIPQGWQYAEICEAKITYENLTFSSPGFVETPWKQSADIRVLDELVGTLCVYYREEMPHADDGPFLSHETRLINSIANRLGHFILHERMKLLLEEYQNDHDARRPRPEWQVVLDMLRQTDRNLYVSMAHKMLNSLSWSGVAEAERLLKTLVSGQTGDDESDDAEDANRPDTRRAAGINEQVGAEIFRIAADHLGDEEFLNRVQKWIQEDKLNFLVKALVSLNTPLAQVVDAVRRYHFIAPGQVPMSSATNKNVRVSLIRRFFTEHLRFINIAKDCIEIADYYDLLQNIVYSADSHGKLGGKSAGLFLARQILRRAQEHSELLGNLKVPKTWYIASDVILSFMHYNNLNEVVEQKYKEINQIRLEYPHIIQTFKNSSFPPEIMQGLSVALDDFGDVPLIVRSSSLLEDRIGAAFSGKYKSLFLANQGTKKERLNALTDAIAEVYASVFGPDPIEYRAERNLLDFHEEMGIMIQEVVGRRIGDYWLPAFAGVAFSRNEFRWSARIKRDDGLIRLVPGLGTRAVDRTSDDYPVLVAPGQPNLRVNMTPDEIIRYSPRKIDVINLRSNRFETMEISRLLQQLGDEIPGIDQFVSILDGSRLRQPVGRQIDFERDDLVFTFEGLISNTPFVKQIRTILQTLEVKFGQPVDIEFASDGRDLYLLQCRQQGAYRGAAGAAIPKDVPSDRIVFTAKRYVSNGHVPPITHIVYVDGQAYAQLPDRQAMLAVGRVVGHLNKLLPKRQFVLMGPGRWGSRGDIKLGVSVTYSDINNTALLVEIARQKGSYLPDLSFGTHFFQDLVEAEIRYLPLYPDDPGVVFNENFLCRAPNILAEVLPEYAHLAPVVRLIDVPRATDGLFLHVLMNAELDEAIGVLGRMTTGRESLVEETGTSQTRPETFWRWRLSMAEQIAGALDPQRFGVKGFYVFGSTKNATAGPGSDIDIIVHFAGSEAQRTELERWLEGWSLCLAELNYLRSGYRNPDGLLDVHFVTDADIAARTSYATKINAVTDAARALPMGRQPA